MRTRVAHDPAAPYETVDSPVCRKILQNLACDPALRSFQSRVRCIDRSGAAAALRQPKDVVLLCRRFRQPDEGALVESTHVGEMSDIEEWRRAALDESSSVVASRGGDGGSHRRR